MQKLIINAAITGMLPTKADTPFVPITTEEIVEGALSCVRAGASILHLHARDESGVPTYRKDIYAQIIEGIRSECPEVILCASLSGRNVSEFEKRSEVLTLDDDLKPDMASLTMSSLNFPKQASVNTPQTIQQLASMMLERGIVPEIEIFDSGMVNAVHYMARKGYLRPPFYCNMILGSLYGAQSSVSDLAYLTQLLPDNTIWACGGIGAYQLKANAAAIVMGGNVRVGVEDNIWYDEGRTTLATNEMLIQRVVRIAEELERTVATPTEAREMLGIPCLVAI